MSALRARFRRWEETVVTTATTAVANTGLQEYIVKLETLLEQNKHALNDAAAARTTAAVANHEVVHLDGAIAKQRQGYEELEAKHANLKADESLCTCAGAPCLTRL